MSVYSKFINKFSQVKVLVIGDIMLDRFIYGTADRISPEAPVPVFKIGHEKQMLGGAGNVVANLTALGCRTLFLGIVGKDNNGKILSKQLTAAGAHSHLFKIDDYPTIVKIRFIAGHHHFIRVDQEERLPIIEDKLPQYERMLSQAIKNVDIVLLSDYNKGIFTPVTTQMIIKLCQKHGKTVIVDPKGTDYSKYAGATLVKPNLKEFSEATSQKYDPKSADFLAQAKKGARVLFDKYGIKNLLVTLSEYGMLYIPTNPAEEVLQIPTVAKEVYDVSGAGDTSLATLGASLGTGASVKEAMQLANIASGIVVGKLGTATVSVKELENAIAHGE